MSLALIRQIERFAANAWPAAEVEDLDGWRLRATASVTRRANSVWPNEHGGQRNLDNKLEAVEGFYCLRHLPARYQICPAALPPELDEALVARGYVEEARTNVQTADLLKVLEQTRARRSGFVSVSDRFNKTWFSTYLESEEVSRGAGDARRGILRRISRPTGFALSQVDGEPAGLGLGVLEQDWVGVFRMATRPAFRRRGVSTAVLHALALWGQDKGATRLYLQVMEANVAARALYAKIGFETLYSYFYRTAPTNR